MRPDAGFEGIVERSPSGSSRGGWRSRQLIHEGGLGGCGGGAKKGVDQPETVVGLRGGRIWRAGWVPGANDGDASCGGGAW